MLRPRHLVAGLVLATAATSAPLLAVDGPQQARIIVFGGHGTSERVIVRGRVVLDPAEPADADANLVSNALHNIDVLESDEVKFAPVLITLPDREIVGAPTSTGCSPSPSS
jgi:hypothetical protein